MHVNEGYNVGILPLSPQGTNSTLFTECCGAAICDDQRKCPACGRLIIGYDVETDHERGKIRWRNATRHWNRKKRGRTIKDHPLIDFSKPSLIRKAFISERV